MLFHKCYIIYLLVPMTDTCLGINTGERGFICNVSIARSSAKLQDEFQASENITNSSPKTNVHFF